MADIFSVEPPRWLVASVNGPNPVSAPEGGVVPGGLINSLRKRDPNTGEKTDSRPNVWDSIAAARKNYEDPLWRKHELQKDTIFSLNQAKANSDLELSRFAANEARAIEAESGQFSQWALQPPDKWRESLPPGGWRSYRFNAEANKMIQNHDDNMAMEKIRRNSAQSEYLNSSMVTNWKIYSNSMFDETGEGVKYMARIKALPKGGVNDDGTPTEDAIYIANEWAYRNGKEMFNPNPSERRAIVAGEQSRLGIEKRGEINAKLQSIKAMDAQQLAALRARLDAELETASQENRMELLEYKSRVADEMLRLSLSSRKEIATMGNVSKENIALERTKQQKASMALRTQSNKLSRTVGTIERDITRANSDRESMVKELEKWREANAFALDPNIVKGLKGSKREDMLSAHQDLLRDEQRMQEQIRKAEKKIAELEKKRDDTLDEIGALADTIATGSEPSAAPAEPASAPSGYLKDDFDNWKKQ